MGRNAHFNSPELNMPLDYVTGDPTLTGWRSVIMRGKTEVNVLAFKRRQQHPPAHAGEHFLPNTGCYYDQIQPGIRADEPWSL